jgi:alpha-tubulin suppressor-like RCC1 family protein
MFYSAANHLYVWGKNKGGRIAGKDVNANVPTIVQAFEGKKIVSMSAGYSHAIVATGEFSSGSLSLIGSC